MEVKKDKPKTIADYISSAPKESQKKLREIRTLVRKITSGATEELKWGMPAYSFSRMLVAFAGYKHHIGLYPTPSAVRAFAKDIAKAKYKTAKGSIQFPLDKPLPTTLIKKIVAFRIKESKEKDALWRIKAKKKSLQY